MYRSGKKKWILPLLVFLIGTGILSTTVSIIRSNKNEQTREEARLCAMTYAERMKGDLLEGIGVTATLEQILISENGRITGFEQVAQNVMMDCVKSIQLAPNGVVTQVYPEEEKKAEEIDLLHDEDRGEISRYARDHDVTVVQGPFEVEQGRYGLAIRNPVYLKKGGESTFWGFVTVIIRVPEIFSDSAKALSEVGYAYRLSKTVSPTDEASQIVVDSEEELKEPVECTFEIGAEQWKLEIMPESGWYSSSGWLEALIGGMVIVLLVTGLTAVLLIFDEHRKTFKQLAVTDALTGIYNRHGFDEQMARCLRQNQNRSCIGVQFDIDDFKGINDVYGHAVGDLALQKLAESMQSFFKGNVVLGRNGGDEFCIFLPDCTVEAVEQKMEKFTKQKRMVVYEGQKIFFSISLGYAEYPKYAKNPVQLMHCADAALYEVKLRGKNGCLAYQEGFRMEIRTQLGFALKDVSEHLPAAFIIYKADPENDEILFANHELIRLAGCSDLDDLLNYTKKYFHNLIRENERETVERSIWHQIAEGDFNDYVCFHLKKKTARASGSSTTAGSWKMDGMERCFMCC
ncbi:MAG: diguanylate cyclase [Lachnospiraceae bacterium]|nr:diguanylate cyclase [Lachnospiraceae bacterium]